METRIAKVQTNGQLSLGKAWGGKNVQVEFLSPTEIRIVSVAVIPEHHLPFFTEEAMRRLAEFGTWEENHTATQTSLSELRADIGRRKKAKTPKASGK